MECPLAGCFRSGFTQLVERLSRETFDARHAPQSPALAAADDEAGAAWGTAAARMSPPFGEGETVVEGEFLAGRNPAPGNDPNPPADRFCAAVGRARMVDEPRDVAWCPAVEIMPSIQTEDVDAVVASAALTNEALRLPPQCLRF